MLLAIRRMRGLDPSHAWLPSIRRMLGLAVLESTCIDSCPARRIRRHAASVCACLGHSAGRRGCFWRLGSTRWRGYVRQQPGMWAAARRVHVGWGMLDACGRGRAGCERSGERSCSHSEWCLPFGSSLVCQRDPSVGCLLVARALGLFAARVDAHRRSRRWLCLMGLATDAQTRRPYFRKLPLVLKTLGVLPFVIMTRRAVCVTDIAVLVHLVRAYLDTHSGGDCRH
mmetsp:Transcript_37383/g.79655  ORF Transcript_37383/g.79655 Transcript_37383/m.79655 type:complete len:227 (-) Transcript_37383:23-703(-)